MRTQDNQTPTSALYRRTYRHVVLLAVTAMLAVACQTARADDDATRPPNIVFIMADDLGYGELGCYGQKRIRTPNLDQLAADGMRFTQFYCGSPVCAPSRCVLMTGKHTGHSYIRNNGVPQHLQHLAKENGWEFPGQNPIPDETVTIAELLKARGYATAAIGKWGLGHFKTSGDPNRQGFDLFYGFNAQRHAHNHYPKFLWKNGVKEHFPGNDRTLKGETFSQDKFTENALKFIEENKDRPFFLYLPFAIPHLAIQAPEKSIAEYRNVLPETDYVHKGYEKPDFPHAAYAAMITHMDRDIGSILELVKKLGLDENTIIFFTSDNGPTYDRLGGSDSEFFESAGPLRGYKGSVFEGGIRVPMIARWRGRIAAGEVSDLICALWDVLPTLTEIAGAETPNDIDGISLAPTLFGTGEQPEHEFLYWEFPSYGGQQAVRMGSWKAVRRDIIHSGVLKTQLYYLPDDIGEMQDVAGDHPDVVQRIETIMRGARVPSELFPFEALDAQSTSAD